MRKRIKHFLNRPFPLFLSNDKGKIYYFLMMVFFILLINITKPFGFENWHEYHRSLVLTFYIGLFFGLYALLNQLFSYLRLYYYNADVWTIKNEFQVLLFFFPSINGCTCIYAVFAVPEFKLTLDALFDILMYNGILSFVSVPTFGFFIDKKLISSQTIQFFRVKHPLRQSIKPIKPFELAQPIEPTLPIVPRENTKSTSHLKEEQALKILQKLNELMKNEQLYLSKNCNLEYVANHSGIPFYHISDAINNFSNDNFNEFINRYRLENACRLIRENYCQQQTLEAIGEQSGFQNRMSFYNAFKKIYGISPSEYKEGLNRE